MNKLFSLLCVLCLGACSASSSSWQLVDNFERLELGEGWIKVDAQNDTDPYVEDPQIAEITTFESQNNRFLLKKAAPDGVLGNRKALTFVELPTAVRVGEIYTFYTRINVEYFPNNHSFGLGNLPSEQIALLSYDAFEPMLRITDKAESDGSRNDGTLMVSAGHKKYEKIRNVLAEEPVNPLQDGEWYELWYVVNNSRNEDGGQGFDLYMRGGEFEVQTLVYRGGKFRMQRELPLTHFLTISNTGSKKSPYGNGGVRYDDVFMAKNMELSVPPSVVLE